MTPLQFQKNYSSTYAPYIGVIDQTGYSGMNIYVPYTGIGFTPKTILMYFGNKNNTYYGSSNWGNLYVATSSGGFSYAYYDHKAWPGNRIMQQDTYTGTIYGEVSSFDSNGFTMHWYTDGGNSTITVRVHYLAFRS